MIIRVYQFKESGCKHEVLLSVFVKSVKFDNL